MPYIQGEPNSVPKEYQNYKEIIENIYIKKGDIGFITIDESIVEAGKPHRGDRAKHGRAIHTEAGIIQTNDGVVSKWGSSWGGRPLVTLDDGVEILLANSINESCAIWNSEHKDTFEDGDIGHVADMYPYSDAHMMKSGEVYKIGLFTPHESLPVKETVRRQFLRIVSSGVHGREPYFTTNSLLNFS